MVGGEVPLHWSHSLDYLKGRWLWGHEVPSCLVYIGSCVSAVGNLFFFFMLVVVVVVVFFKLKWPASLPLFCIYLSFVV